MRRPDEDMLDPQLVETLDAVDATLAGDPVAPRFAEIAELSLLLNADRPPPGAEFSRALDERVAARFARPEPDAPRSPRAWLRSWSLGAFGAASAAAAAAIVAVVIVVSGGGGARQSSELQTATRAPAALAPPAASSGAATTSSSTAQPSGAGGATDQGFHGLPAPSARAVQPPPNGRKIIQSATLYLGAPPARVDDVAQQVFNVVGSVNGIVDHSSVTSTGGPDGSAQFALRVPSASLAQTMAALSRLRYANVLSRTDNTQDVNPRFVDATRELADAQALRAALVKQLAAATTQGQIDSLKAQLKAAEARIATAQSGLRNLNRQVDYSQISLTIQAGTGAGATTGAGSGGGFSLHTAAHDALRVLTVAVGAGLIALAVLIPVGLLAALAWWVVVTVRRRRREHALDLA